MQGLGDIAHKCLHILKDVKYETSPKTNVLYKTIVISTFLCLFGKQALRETFNYQHNRNQYFFMTLYQRLF
jgi:hypothetical protein